MNHPDFQQASQNQDQSNLQPVYSEKKEVKYVNKTLAKHEDQTCENTYFDIARKTWQSI